MWEQLNKNKPENPFQTVTSQKIGIIYVKCVQSNLSAQFFFQYNHRKYKNRKPDRKQDPGPEIFSTKIAEFNDLFDDPTKFTKY